MRILFGQAKPHIQAGKFGNVDELLNFMGRSAEEGGLGRPDIIAPYRFRMGIGGAVDEDVDAGGGGATGQVPFPDLPPGASPAREALLGTSPQAEQLRRFYRTPGIGTLPFGAGPGLVTPGTLGRAAKRFLETLGYGAGETAPETLGGDKAKKKDLDVLEQDVERRAKNRRRGLSRKAPQEP
jgi:hypothetical protein